MTMIFARAALIAAALLLAGCNESLEDIAPKAEHQLPEAVVRSMKAQGMRKNAPIMMRIFKEEGVLEIWKRKDTGRFGKIASYDICKWSGELGPKYTEGDRQAPEGFYDIHSYQMNPNSSYYLSFNIGYPNAFDRVHGRTGSNLMVHGACSSAGCYSMTDEQVADIYAFARDAFAGGQDAFQIEALPFRMTPENMARYRGDPNYEFWTMLKEGYDYFEITKVPPKVDVCNGRYVFNQIAEEGHGFSATDACPPTTQPEQLRMAYRTYQTNFDAAFSAALNSGKRNDPKPTIAGMKEANLVADWTRRRAEGESVSRTPPSLEAIAAAEADTKARATQTAEAATPAEPDAARQAGQSAQRPEAVASAKPAPAAGSEDVSTTGSVAKASPAQASPETAENTAVPVPRSAPNTEAKTASTENKGAIGRLLSLF